MARFYATVPRSFAEVWPVVDDVARSQGFGVHRQSTKHDRVYSQDAGWNSWGYTVKVQLKDRGDETGFTCDVRAFALIDRRRARKAVERLILTLGGTID